jgi:hypothetical protein
MDAYRFIIPGNTMDIMRKVSTYIDSKDVVDFFFGCIDEVGGHIVGLAYVVNWQTWHNSGTNIMAQCALAENTNV